MAGEEQTWLLEETSIEMGGVMRCCHATVATEYEGQRVKLGHKSACRYCKTGFTLVRREGPKPVSWTEAGWNRPVWKPDWQLEKKT